MARRKAQKPKPRQFDNRPLAALKALDPQAPAAAARPAPAPAPPPEKIEETDEELLSSAMTGVRLLERPLDDLPPPPAVPPRRPVPELEAEEVMQTLRELVEGDAPLDITETEETLEGSVPGLDPRVLRQLRAGEFSIQDHLDLHQLTRQEAKERVERFLHDSILHGKRCLLIIHGRGLGSKDHVPVLKNALRAWFQRSGVRKQILAFTTARPCDGGSGAVYVLLRKRQRG